jgi:two-component system nitrate/nitrite response regulator NarL
VVTPLLILAEAGVYREALAGSLERDERFSVVAVVSDVEGATAALEDVKAEVLLMDARMPGSTHAVWALAAAAPQVKIVALGVPQPNGHVIALAEAGASGYVPGNGSVEDLAAVVESVSRGETLCSPEIAATLFRRVATLARERRLDIDEQLTARELEVLRLIEEGFSNKEIGSALSIELSTVKNHVHRILEKLKVRRRTEAVARARRLGLLRLGVPGKQDEGGGSFSDLDPGPFGGDARRNGADGARLPRGIGFRSNGPLPPGGA